MLLCAAFLVLCLAFAAAFGSPTDEKPTLAAFLTFENVFIVFVVFCA